MLATVGFKGNVDYTVVNGKIAVKNGELVQVDEADIVCRANCAVQEHLSRQ